MLPGAVLPTKHRLGLYAVDAGNRHARQIRGRRRRVDGRGQRAARLRVSEDAPWGGRCYSCLAPGSRPTTLTYHAGPGLGPNPVQAPQGLHERSEPVDRAGRRRTRPHPVLLLPSVPRHARRPRPEAGPLGVRAATACLFVPKYRVLGPAGEAWYAVRPDTCACGMCVECRCGGRGAKCCRVPFYVRHPETRAKLDGGNAVFVDLWAGWAAEMCTRRDLYEMKFPAGATSAQGRTLLGCAHLIDLTVKEQEGN